MVSFCAKTSSSVDWIHVLLLETAEHSIVYKMPLRGILYEECLNQKCAYLGRDINKMGMYLKSLL